MKKTRISFLAIILILVFLMSSCGVVVFDDKSSSSSSSSSEVSQVQSEEETSEDTFSQEPSKNPEVSSNKPSSKPPTSTTSDKSQSSTELGPITNMSTYKQKTDLGWNLKLVNRVNTITRNDVPKLATIKGGTQFDARASAALEKMVDDCQTQNITIWAQSTYRSYDNQDKIFNNYINKFIKQGYSREKAVAETLTFSMPAGSSEHNLGLAVDFNNIDSSFANTAASKWLLNNAADYGFILRYPKDKVNVTGVSYEPWHYRYVGVEHAKAMKQKGYVLEEYIEFLENNQ